MSSMPSRIRSAIFAVIASALLPIWTASAAEYFGQTSARLQITDVNGAPLPSHQMDTTFVEAAPFAEIAGPGIAFDRGEVSTDSAGGFVDGFQAVLGLAGASTGTPSQVTARWLGGVLVGSSRDASVLASVSLFTVVAGKADVPEELASSAVTLDLVFGAVDPTCIDQTATSTRGVDLDCFDVVVRIPLDDQRGVALPDFLTHTTLFGEASAQLVGDIVEGAPDGPAPAVGGAERRAVIGISAGAPVLVGIEASAIGDAAITGEPRCFGQVATLIGTDGNDSLRGTRGDDVILALGGNDFVTGKQGNDLICGGDGNDRLVGHQDDDRIAGEGGDDKIDGYYGDDFIVGGPGDDFIQGCDGDDVVDGGAGNDRLRGERGDDLILGGTGNDNIKGASGSDVVIGGQDVSIDISVTLNGLASINFSTADETDNDKVNGDRNDDIVEGGPGNDRLKGGKGNDLIDGGRGVDTLFGGGGSGDDCTDEDDDTTFFECEAD